MLNEGFNKDCFDTPSRVHVYVFVYIYMYITYDVIRICVCINVYIRIQCYTPVEKASERGSGMFEGTERHGR